VTDISPDVDWSPADNPYAIAVSQATWWFSAVRLSVGRLHDPKDRRALPVSSTQIDARSLVIALVQVLRAEKLEPGTKQLRRVAKRGQRWPTMF
jgi:hypothetical protein